MSAKCTDCGRKVSTDVIGPELCDLCLEYAEWENAHSDHGHDEIAKTPEGTYPAAWGVPAKSKLAEDLAYVASERTMMGTCPVCHPELDPRKPRREVTGTSRLGMVMVVPVRAPGEDKAAAVKAQLQGFRGAAEANDANGVTLRLTKGSKAAKITVEANWDMRGRWIGGTVNGKKARNASELLRLVAQLG
jgi:hypothetical protein